MKLLHFVLLAILLGCLNAKPQFDIELPEGYVVEVTSDEYNLLTASKYSNGEAVAMIEIRYSDDWSFSTFSNEVYIAEMLENDHIEKAASMMFENFNIHSKEKLYLTVVGDCVSSIYSGDYYENGVRVTNFVVQFVKNDNLFTLSGSAFPENFSSEYKSFLKSFDTFTQ